MNDTLSWRRDLLLLFVVIGLFFAIGLGARPYLAPSEARYIELPRQMLATGDFLTPRINGVPYFEKPPLFYWLQAAVLGLFGMGEFSGRIVTALLTTLTCLITYACARMLYGRATGLLSATILATCVLGYSLSRIAVLDVSVTLFITATLACFIAAQKNPRFYIIMYIASALAMMSKGLIGIVIPGMVIGAWIVCTRRWTVLKEARLFTGLIIFGLIAAPWHIMMAQKHPDFLNFYFIHEHFTRYLTDEHKRNQPWWFFIGVTIAGLLPWVGLLPGALKQLKWKTDPNALFLLLWALLPFLFFSASHSKLASYIFPIFPPLVIMMGHYVSRVWSGDVGSKTLCINIIGMVLLFGICAAAYPFLPALPGKAGKAMAVLPPIPLPMLLPVLLVLVALLASVVRNRPARHLIVMLAFFGATLGISANYIGGLLDQTSIKPLVEAMPPLHDDDMVVAYDSYWQDLPVYLGRNVTIAGWTGELSFGTEHYPETHAWMIDDAEFWQRCAAAPHEVYVFMTRDTYNTLLLAKFPGGCPLHLLGGVGKTVLLQKDRS